MKKADNLINSLFNLNRKDLLNELNRGLIKDFRRDRIIQAAQDLVTQGQDLSHEKLL